MNHTEHQEKEPQKDAVMKTLAIIGFIVAIIVLAWVAVQAVRFIPPAFTTLATLVEGLGKKDGADFAITTKENMVNVGETYTISWKNLGTDGSYAFSYGCADGVSLTVKDGEDMDALTCETELVLDEEAETLDVVFASEKNRFTDVLYTIAFIGDEDVTYERDSIVTVINPDIAGTSTPTPEEEPQETPEEETPTTGGPQTVASHPTRTVPVVTTSFPVSNPNGYADLAVKFIGVGEYRNGRFDKNSSLEDGEDGAVQFEVRNIGTKTSGTWNFRAELPTADATDFISASQAGLLPNERQIVTLRFGSADEDEDHFEVTVYGGGDTRLGNNTISTRVDID